MQRRQCDQLMMLLATAGYGTAPLLCQRQGHPEAATPWTPQVDLGYLMACEEVTLARTELAHDQTTQALTRLARQAQRATATGRRGLLMKIRLLEALAYQRRGSTDSALRAVEEGLVLAEAEGELRLFLDEGEPMRDLLTRWLRQRRRPVSSQERLGDYVRTVLAVFAQMAPRNALSPCDASGSAPLSIREHEILRAVAAGKSNKEIAMALVLTVGTVKWHLKHIYRKLHAHSRTQALLHAGALGILSPTR
jgi:LuxR family maltose regulon positive regulatory protein